ncbi:DUF3991 domain-containing protein [Agathobaculum sp. NTUH-O15-33]|uniref:DUF3991 domain-containing protein n=1 Tax=Agathobaculum sp. NTUH-O15-33 TaxID=3079302 RepID=UPI0029585724|nr:DUF3991 domain-containing protein [Agathobaculum sp. NTUH-O15-33]WNX84082.1 DUF3991 domain-containing protein [Agathobaculum sp. NTUH-O15-33]
MKAGIFYESRNYHNCVFVGKDKTGKDRFACMRGTMGNFKADVQGSDKRFNFCLLSSDPSSGLLAVFESPRDVLSLAMLRKVKRTAWDKCNHLSWGGTAPLALPCSPVSLIERLPVDQGMFWGIIIWCSAQVSVDSCTLIIL